MPTKELKKLLDYCLNVKECSKCEYATEKECMLTCSALIKECLKENYDEVVRCKDCEYCEVLEMDYGEKQYWCKFWNTPKREYADAFCCHGKPKETL